MIDLITAFMIGVFATLLYQIVRELDLVGNLIQLFKDWSKNEQTRR
jgi:hypothetical protein